MEVERNEFCVDNGMEFKILTEDQLFLSINNIMAQSKYYTKCSKSNKRVDLNLHNGIEIKSREFGTPKDMDLIRDGKQSTKTIFW